MEIIRFVPGDTLLLKKKHPCGSDSFTVLRGGTEVRLICNGCSRDMTLDRVKLERAIKKVIIKDEKEGQ